MREFSAIGNNIHQISVKANALGFIDTQKLNSELERLHKFQADMERQFLRPGQIFYQGIDITNPRQFAANKKLLQTSRQMIFQDSTSSLNGRMKVCDIIAEPMRIARMTPKRGTYRKEAAFQMKYVGLDEMYLDKYPAELSGRRLRQLFAAGIFAGRAPRGAAGRLGDADVPG